MSTDAAGAVSQPAPVAEALATARRAPLSSATSDAAGVARAPLTVLGATDVGFCEGDSCVLPGTGSDSDTY